MSDNFRFGVGVNRVHSRTALTENARRFEDLGYDVFIVPDHLGAIAPFPALAAAAAVTSTITTPERGPLMRQPSRSWFSRSWF